MAGLGLLEMFVFIDLLQVDKNLSYFLQSVISLQLNFIFNANLTWSGAAGSWWGKWLRFHSTRIAIALICQILFAVIEGTVGYPIAYAVTILLASIFNFVTSDRWVFAKKIAVYH